MAEWTDLRPRVLSALMMVAIAGVALWRGGVWMQELAVLLAAGMAAELARLCAPARPRLWLALGLLTGALVAVALLSRFELRLPLALLLPALVLFLGAERLKGPGALYAALIAAAAISLGTLRADAGLAPVLWLILVIIASDVAGYFAGRSLGGPKFWPAVSPKKTWSGTVAGWLGAGLVGAGFVWAGHGGAALLLLSPLVAFVGQMGDIAESWLKRRAGVKDSSNLIPGHGGLLDRFDALIAGAAALWLWSLLAPVPVW